MRELKVIYRGNGIRLDGRMLERAAVRGIIIDGRKLLMVYSSVNGDYKFPGGGVDAQESAHEALAREVREECGARLAEVCGEFGQVVEYWAAKDPGFDTFRMTSSYYVCRVEPELGALKLDDYERDLGFGPAWVPIDEAIATNWAVMMRRCGGAPRWTPRDTFVLERVRAELLDGAGAG